MSGAGAADRPAFGASAAAAGWLLVAAPQPGVPASARVFPRFAFLADALPQDARLAVGVPIGLPARIEGAGRSAEKAVRSVLGGRQSAVFSTPSRGAVEAGAGPFADDLARREAYAAAAAIARATSHPPRGVSIQGFGLFPRIAELDAALRGDARLRERVVESHAEAACWALNGEAPLASPKTVKGVAHAAGLQERRRLLEAHGFEAGFLYGAPPAGADVIALVDAAALSLVARRVAQGLAHRFPAHEDRDETGLPIRIFA